MKPKTLAQNANGTSLNAQAQPCHIFHASEMLRICFAASGDEVAIIEASHSDYVSVVNEHGSTVGSLKRFLAEKHFQKRYSRFQLRLLHAGDPNFLEDDESVTPPAELRLVVLPHLPLDRDRDSEFLLTCHRGSSEEVEQKLEALQNPQVMTGFPLTDIDDVGPKFTPLYLAALAGHANVVRLLIEAGAALEWRSVSMNWMTALAAAAMRGQLEVIRALLDHGAEKEAATASLGGKRPLHLAAKSNHVEVVRLLLDRRADIEATDDHGWRALHFAAHSGHKETVRLLRDRGAQEARNVDGDSPTTIAVRRQLRKRRLSTLQREVRRRSKGA